MTKLNIWMVLKKMMLWLQIIAKSSNCKRKTKVCSHYFEEVVVFDSFAIHQKLVGKKRFLLTILDVVAGMLKEANSNFHRAEREDNTMLITFLESVLLTKQKRETTGQMCRFLKKKTGTPVWEMFEAPGSLPCRILSTLSLKINFIKP